MDEVAAAQARERVARWIEESREVFSVIPELLANDQRLSAKSEHAERESERLRRELADARRDAEGLQRDVEGLQRELEQLRKENQTLRSEKDEAAQAFAKLLETVQSTNQIAQKLGVTKSPFARAREAAPAPSPHE